MIPWLLLCTSTHILYNCKQNPTALLDSRPASNHKVGTMLCEKHKSMARCSTPPLLCCMWLARNKLTIAGAWWRLVSYVYRVSTSSQVSSLLVKPCVIIIGFVCMVVLQEMSWLRRNSLLWSAWKRLMASRENCAHSHLQSCCNYQ